MHKTTKATATKSPKQSHKDSSSTKGKKTGHVRKKTTAAIASQAQQSEASDDELKEPATDAALKAPARIVWDKYPERTERLLDYLDAHPDVTIKLFRDSTQVAKSEGRTKLTAKSNKTTGYLQVADGIFSIDDDEAVWADFAANPNKYAKAVDNHIINT